MKRIFLLLSAIAALGTAGCCCCQGYNTCGDNSYGYNSNYGYNNGAFNNNGCSDDGCQMAGGPRQRHQNCRNDRDCGCDKCQSKNKCKLRGRRCRNNSPGHVCNADCYGGGVCEQCGMQLGDAGCCGMDCGVIQTGCSGDCGCGMQGGCASGNCGGAPTGGCASGNCGNSMAPSMSPTPVPVNPPTTSSTNSYDPELQALQAAGWTIMPSTSSSSSNSATSNPTPIQAPMTFSAPPVPSGHISEPVAAPPAGSSGNFLAPIKPTGAR